MSPSQVPEPVHEAGPRSRADSDTTPAEVERERARALVLRLGWNATAYQLLNPGMRRWYAAAGDAVAGYVVHGHRWVVAGAPVCAGERLPDVAMELERDCAAAGARSIYFGAGTRLEQVLAAGGNHQSMLIGAQPVWDATAWPIVVQRKASLRAQLNRARNKGVSTREWSPAMTQHHPALGAVLREWLGTRGLPPLHFMTEADTLGDLRDRRVFVAERAPDGVIAFLVATPVPQRNGWLIEQWPRSMRAPNGTTHLLIDTAMRALAADGARYVTLGLAPLSDHAGTIGERQPLWLRALLRWARAHGRRFYNFRGLDAFKTSLEPASWEPVYAVVQGARIGPGALRAIAGAFGGGSPERLIARALGMAIAREWNSLRYTFNRRRESPSPGR